MNATQTSFDERSVTQEIWHWVQSLIEDVASEQQRDAFARRLFQWDLAVKQFRKIEMKRVILQAPAELDLHFHGLCLSALLAQGHALVIESLRFTPDALSQFEVRHEDIRAYVEELEQSYREWHHGFSAEEVAKAQTAIFGAAA